ncbi:MULTISPECIES: OsmC family protein [Pseudomonas]|jgi:osmotically inducible protein OsmC|uniref:OsmC family peroxiredoxin n=3 Tax=Pseudomonas TaxID=286 RepID=A0A0U4VIA8_9PSED|nr:MULTISPECIES: OsmC family protein [Pseudomonas]ALZ82775.1 osmotically inducible protein OsmC [Pseudomonas oryzihabitans]AXA64702.1 OsmC family peroxiredoxin [Pseudomonas oryzihabitans]MCD4864003.1 OsmC family protein [Pseudomonas sp. PLB05]MDC7828785.1 OsmC family protein [Pseudomonas benzopyrenica]MDH4764902.1 OsmC family protein [Pseudomonas sp. CBMAI 2609]
MKKYASAVWQGGLKDGKGHISTESGALKDNAYGFNTRFEGTPGTNPEELIGAAHAGCFSMAFSMLLGQNGLTPERIETKADVTLDKVGDGFEITTIDLTMKAKIPGATQEQFTTIANQAKEGCPVSKVLKGAKINLNATLEG